MIWRVFLGGLQLLITFRACYTVGSCGEIKECCSVARKTIWVLGLVKASRSRVQGLPEALKTCMDFSFHFHRFCSGSQYAVVWFWLVWELFGFGFLINFFLNALNS